VSSAYDEPFPTFPDNLVKFFDNSEVSVFAYPNTYTCSAPGGERIACVVDSDSLYFMRKGKVGVKMSLRGEGKRIAVFGGPRVYECQRFREADLRRMRETFDKSEEGRNLSD